MKPAFLCLTLLLHTAITNGQLAVIKDPDGFTNVRKKDSSSSAIMGQFHNGEVFLFDTESAKSGWIQVFYHPKESSDSGYLQGFLHADRLLPIDKLPHISPTSKRLKNGHLTLRNDSMTFEIVAAPFLPKQHKIGKDKSGFVLKIDGRKPVGTDGNIPRVALVSLTITVNGRPLEIPPTAWNDLYEPGLETCNAYFDLTSGYMYLYMPSCSDGAGFYSIAWIFRNGRYLKRYIDAL